MSALKGLVYEKFPTVTEKTILLNILNLTPEYTEIKTIRPNIQPWIDWSNFTS